MAFIIYSSSSVSSEVCSGTVISPNVILTAGHCAVDLTTGVVHNPDQYTVITGSADWTDSSRRRLSSVTQVLPYPLYNPVTASSDAALLVLSSPISAAPIALPTNADQYLESPGTGASIAGWGETYTGSGPAYLLQWAPTVVQSPSYCSRYPSNLSYSPATNLCTTNPPAYNTGTCQGDSGGPLFATDSTGTTVELGITSYGPVGCTTTLPDFFTAVLPLSGWIQQEVHAVAPVNTTPLPPSPSPAQPPRPPANAILSFADGRLDARRTLDAVFHQALMHAHAYRASCQRVSSTRIRCKVSFGYGPNAYSGHVIISYMQATAKPPGWIASYLIREVNDACSRTSHCRARVRKGTVVASASPG